MCPVETEVKSDDVDSRLLGCLAEVPHWGDASDEGCKSPGYRQMSARLWGSSSRSNWNADCKATPFSPNKYETLSRSLSDVASNCHQTHASTMPVSMGLLGLRAVRSSFHSTVFADPVVLLLL